jgi:elongation factor P
MDVATFEQILLSPDIVGDTKFYLKENLEVTGLVHDGRILDIKVPIFIEARVVETEPGFKGDTVQAAKKPAKLETGLTILVPLFINSGDTIKLDTRTNEYITRV